MKDFVLILALTNCLHLSAADSVVRVTAEAQGLEQIPPQQLPNSGTFWITVSGGNSLAPLPCPPTDLSLPMFQIADGQFLVDDSAGTPLAALERQARAVVQLIDQIQNHALVRAAAFALGIPDPGDPGEGDYDYTPPVDTASLIDTNVLWLEIASVSNSLANLNLHKATAPVYAIWTTTNLLTAWRVERDLWPTSSSSMPFTLPTLGRPNLFVRAQDWTGVDGNSNSIPDWWEWKYLTNLTGTNVIRALSTSFVDVSNAVAQATFGQTVFVPAGTNSWNKTLYISGISLIGLGTNETRILDAEPDGSGNLIPMIQMTTVTNAFTRLSNLTLMDSTNGYQNYKGKVYVNALAIFQWRIDHCVINQLKGDNIVVDGIAGLIDHCTFVLQGTAVRQNGKILYGYGDLSWASPPTYGSISNLFIEDNWFTNIVYGSSSSAVFDGYYGSRSVFRRNQVFNTFWSAHGTESTGRARGTRAFEIYNNTFYDDQDFDRAMHFRSGTGAVFSNTATGYKSLGGISNYRNTDPFDPWGGVNGTTLWDSNSPALSASGTHSGTNNSPFLQVTGAPWTVNQWVGYSVVNTNVVRTTNSNAHPPFTNNIAGRFSIIVSNSASKIYYHDPKDFSLLTFTNGDHYQIYFCYPALDQVGRGSGDLITGDDSPINSATGTAT